MANPFATGPDWRILHAVARRHSWEGEGWLSIKTFRGGRAHYSVGAAHHAVDDDSYLILNHGRKYSIEIDLPNPLESFCVFLAPHLAADVFQTCANSHARLLDGNPNSSPVDFFEKKYSHDNTVSPLMRRLQKSHRACERGKLEEQIHRLAFALLIAHQAALREAEQLPNVRPATRHELYRRAAIARDFADAMFAEPLTLGDIARAAALSPNHLLRVFSQVYRQTPHQFLTARRLAEAAHLLVWTETSVTEICVAVGFESLGSFVSLFKRRFGLTPGKYRATKK
jgi:AraC-like DNA-binding protein